MLNHRERKRLVDALIRNRSKRDAIADVQLKLAATGEDPPGFFEWLRGKIDANGAGNVGEQVVEGAAVSTSKLQERVGRSEIEQTGDLVNAACVETVLIAPVLGEVALVVQLTPVVDVLLDGVSRAHVVASAQAGV
jgi:hypothetical protein